LPQSGCLLFQFGSRRREGKTYSGEANARLCGNVARFRRSGGSGASPIAFPEPGPFTCTASNGSRKPDAVVEVHLMTYYGGNDVLSSKAQLAWLSIGRSQPNEPNASAQPQIIAFTIDGNQGLPR
jgi:hypothetical protein